ncbi:hypothetical protein RGQ29_002354 [Quercus rubra]|nr:hypothetical protein RGQ29_002354 [Quercus rubra]
MFCSASSVIDPYKTLKIQPGASESDVKKAFRQLALQYHPDVCRGSNCGVQFHKINEAYDAEGLIGTFLQLQHLDGTAISGFGRYQLHQFLYPE